MSYDHYHNHRSIIGYLFWAGFVHKHVTKVEKQRESADQNINITKNNTDSFIRPPGKKENGLITMPACAVVAEP